MYFIAVINLNSWEILRSMVARLASQKLSGALRLSKGRNNQ